MILNANEARRKSQMVVKEKHDKETQEVKKAIGDAIGRGEYDATIFHCLSKSVINDLRYAGYRIEEVSGGMNETNTKIRWD